KQQMQEMGEKQQEMKKNIADADSVKDLKELQRKVEEIEGKEELFEDMIQELKERLEAATEQEKQKLKDKIEEMTEDGFMKEERRDELESKLEEATLDQLEKLEEEIKKEEQLHDRYLDLRQEVRPLVEQWYRFFAERLPKQQDIEQDEDSLTRQGAFNRRSLMRFRNLILGTIKNPRVIRESMKPKFLVSIVLDVSGSMEGEKLKNALKMLVFYCELFNLIGKEFGYIRFSIHIFSDTVREIKDFEHDYESQTPYAFENGKEETIKVRLMSAIQASGGTDMLPAIKKAAESLNQEKWEYPDYASALYFMGDGGDTSGNALKIREFLRINDEEQGFGEHMYSATLMGDESMKGALASIFGEEHTTVAPDFDTLVEESMMQFSGDIDCYMRDKTS
ncbi:MAG: hypothetical protein WCW30_04220, partial [Candidatus Gracilibacteria bacterium]